MGIPLVYPRNRDHELHPTDLQLHRRVSAVAAVAAAGAGHFYTALDTAVGNNNDTGMTIGKDLGKVERSHMENVGDMGPGMGVRSDTGIGRRVPGKADHIHTGGAGCVRRIQIREHLESLGS